MFKNLIKAAVKRIPTPTYGHYGGYYKRCKNKRLGICPIPVDWMDNAFRQHDLGESNSQLIKRLKAGDPNSLRHKVYGKAFRQVVILLFSIEVKLGIEHP